MTRFAVLLASGYLLLHAVLPAQPRVEPFVPVGVTYPRIWGADGERVLRDLPALRKAGFNSLTAVVRWAEIEPASGAYQFEPVMRLLTAAADGGLRVILQFDVRGAPPWLLAEHPDARFATAASDPRSQGRARICLDHAVVRRAARAAVGALVKIASRTASFLAIDVGSDLPGGFCACAHTRRRFEEWSRQSSSTDRDGFLRDALRDDLEQMANAAGQAISHARVPSLLQGGSDRPGQDDWLMSAVVQQYGTEIGPAAPSARADPVTLALAFDAMRAAARGKGWMMRAAPLPPDDGRLTGWAALSRGARSLMFASWQDAPDLPGIVARNPGLFLGVMPRPARVAIVHDPDERDAAWLAPIHRALLRRNVPVDLLHAGEADRVATQYRVVITGAPTALSAVARRSVTDAGGTVIDARAPDTLDRLAALLASAGVAPDVRIAGAAEGVEARFLESSTVLMLIALNHADTSQKVTLHFAPDTQEAIWVNLETGSGVNFIAGTDGPRYEYWFRPRDVLVLMIRKDIR